MEALATNDELRLADAYVAQTTPTMTVPMAAPLPPLETVGHRFLVAKDGLYVEFRRAWCYGIQRIGESSMALPFGSVTPVFKAHCGRPPAWMYERFLANARSALPNEVACWFVWNQNKRGADAWRLVDLRPTSSDADHITFNREVLDAGEHVVVDIHSHGDCPAFFSGLDDINDSELRDVKIAVVAGHIRSIEPQSKQRLCILGAFIDRGSCNEISAAA